MSGSPASKSSTMQDMSRTAADFRPAPSAKRAGDHAGSASLFAVSISGKVVSARTRPARVRHFGVGRLSQALWNTEI